MNRALERARRIPPLLPCAASIALLAIACAVSGDGQERAVAPQRWDETRGPVVPHDGFPSDCSLCHAGGEWHAIRDDFTFDHERETGVPLAGAHAEAECLRCHNDRGPVERFAARGCVGCHPDPHRGLLGEGCVDCHDERTWQPTGVFADHARTRFPLTGAHVAVVCDRCHTGTLEGNFVTGDLRCEDCHEDDLERAVDPKHQPLGWTTRCETCHLPTNWKRDGFRHTFFRLDGAHASLHCTQCHTPELVTAQADCVSCHREEYDATTDPPHARVRYGTQCQDCHTSSSWLGAPFNHPWFPIERGAHADITCHECHPVRGSFGISTCISCHAHARRPMNIAHEGVDGYVYDTAACFACHPTGRVRR